MTWDATVVAVTFLPRGMYCTVQNARPDAAGAPEARAARCVAHAHDHRGNDRSPGSTPSGSGVRAVFIAIASIW